MPSEPRRGREPFRWRIASAAGVSVPEAAGRLRELGLVTDGQGEGWARLRAGSQFQTRLLGGYFVDPARLPISVTLTEPPSGGVEARVEDSIGPIAVRDRALEARYALRAAQIRDAIEGARGTGPLKTAGSARSGGS
jgi:hypothetical protein